MGVFNETSLDNYLTPEEKSIYHLYYGGLSTVELRMSSVNVDDFGMLWSLPRKPGDLLSFLKKRQFLTSDSGALVLGCRWDGGNLG